MANRTENVGIFTAYGFAREGGYVGTKAEFEEGLAKSANYATNAQASATAAANSATSASTMATAAASSAGAAAGSANTAAGYAQDADEFAQAAAASADEAEGYAESLDPDTIARIDGYYDLLTAGYADNLTPHSDSAGASQNTPFILQGSGCANGEEQADTGSYCQLQRKNGNTVTVNQLIKNGTFVGSSNWGYYSSNISAAFANNTATLTMLSDIPSTGKYNYGIYQVIGYLTVGHKYYISFRVKTDGTAMAIDFDNLSSDNRQITGLTSGVWTNIGIIVEAITGIQNTVFFFPSDLLSGQKIEFQNMFIIDLTLWFGSNDKIPTHLLNHPEDFFRYYQGSLAYNAGTLTDCNGRYLKTMGRNVWDEVTESGYYDLTTGQPMAQTGVIRGKNRFKVIPNTPYYFACKSIARDVFRILWYDANDNFISSDSNYNDTNVAITSPANACYCRIYFSGTYGITYNHDITISLYYEGESGYDQYYPYEELANIDTGSEELLAFDYKTPDGTIHKETGRVDLGTVDWHKSTNGPTSAVRIYYATNLIADAKYDETNLAIKCSKYSAASSSDIYQGRAKQVIAMFTSGMNKALWIQDDIDVTDEQFKTSLSGVYLEYELETPTTEQGTPFAENVAIDDFGTMSFDCPNGVPQGNTVFYPVDYKAEIDTLHNITDGDMHKIALKGDLAEGEPETIEEVVDYINARIPAPPAEDGTYNLTVTVASGEATYSWVSAT